MRAVNVFAILLVGLIAAGETYAAPQARLVDTHWAISDESSPATVDHSSWDDLLAARVSDGPNGVSRFDYGGVDKTNSANLDAYIEKLAGTAPTRLSRSQQLAYWINLYNALTVKTVIAHYPVKSILKVLPTSFLSPGPWKRDLVTVEGRALSLDDIEHGILRPIWKDPRIHYAVNCASIGCPNLAGKAYKADSAQQMLTEAARGYVNHPRGVSIENGKLILSRLYNWYATDFGDTDEKVIAHIMRYAEPKLAAALDGATRIRKYRYDWSLNDKERGVAYD